MGETTKIAWTDSTVNFWWGCTKVGEGCTACYAEQFSKRMGHNIWGVGVPRRKIKSAVPLIRKLNARTQTVASLYPRVFIQSMSDLFDLEVPVEWFDEAWVEIIDAERLRIQIVTKRVTAIEKRLRAWRWPPHAGLIITVVNQEEADRDVPRALALKAKLGIPWLGLSVEPQIAHLILLSRGLLDGVDWVISGGESKQGKDHKPRPYDLAWARSLRDQCAAASVAFFMKQLGSNPRLALPEGADEPPFNLSDKFLTNDRAGADPSEWPADLRVQQFPEALR